MLVYTLFSPKGSVFYVGFTTETVEVRLQRHLETYYGHSFTSKYQDWYVYLVIDCASIAQARKVESHIKRMNSKRFIF